MPITKKQLLEGVVRFNTEIGLCRASWGGCNEYDCKLDALRDAITGRYADGFLDLPQNEVMDPQIEQAYMDFQSVRRTARRF